MYIFCIFHVADQQDEQSVPLALVGGITGSISAILITIIVIGSLYLWRRRQVPGNFFLSY